jgi:hypothetical protein
LERLLSELKDDADKMPTTEKGKSWSKRISNIQKQLDEYRNACDDYAAYLLNRKGR